MTAIHWKTQTSADFNTAPDWSTGTVPGAKDDAILDAAGASNYTVTASTAETVNSIQTAATATLSITVSNGSGAFTATAGTGSGANLGTIAVANNSNFVVGGTVSNKGKITLNGTGNVTSLQIATTNATFSGGGKIVLGDSGQNQIFGIGPTTTLTNVDNTISGAGRIGNAQVDPNYDPTPGLVLINQAKGVIDATGSNALVLDTGANAVSNAGILEGTGLGGLTIASTTVNNSGAAAIQATNASNVTLQSADIVGGTFATQGSGVIQTNDRGTLLDGTISTVTNNGTFNVNNNTSVNIQGTIANAGKFNLNSVGSVTQVVVTAKNATLSGAGSMILSDNTQNSIVGTVTGARNHQVVSNFTNNSTISGAGQIGANLSLVNGGTINATGQFNALVIATGSFGIGQVVPGSNVVTNTGLLESTNVGKASSSGGLVLSNLIINNNKGTLEANGLHTHVDLASTTIIGGTFVTATTGVIQTTDRGSLLDGTSFTVTNTGTLNIQNNTSLTIQGSITNTGVGAINLNSTGNVTQLVISAKSATLTGGTVNLSDNTQNFFVGTITGPANGQKVSVLDNFSTIQGAGNLGQNLLINNESNGIIDATGANTLVLTAGNSGVFDSTTIHNDGLLESTNPNALGALGGLTISNVTVVDVSGAGAIEANGIHSHVDFQSAQIFAGNLKTTNGGVIETADRGTLLSGTAHTLINQATLDIQNNTSLAIQGSFGNFGTLNLMSVGNVTQLIIGSASPYLSFNSVTLGGLGAGQVNLSDSSQNFIIGAFVNSTLTNTNNTIAGAGQIGAGQGNLTLVNQAKGIVNATGASNALVIDTAGHVVTNSGLMEGSGAAGLTILSTTVDNSSGGVMTANNNSVVTLTGATLNGGTLTIAGTGAFQTGSSDRGSVLDGQTSTINNQGLVNITNNASLTLQGAISNTGKFAMQSIGNVTQLIIDTTNVTLSGKGEINLSNNTQNFIIGATASSTLTNVDNKIDGAGQLGNGQLVLVNQKAGVVDANVSTALVLNVGTTAVANSGLLEATAGGTLVIQNSTVNGSTGGVIAVDDASAVNLQNSTLVGGTMKLLGSGTGVIQTVDFYSVFDGTTLTGKVVNAVNNAATVNILNNTGLTLQGQISNSGSINLQSVGNVTQLVIDTTNAQMAGGVTLSGGGTVTLTNNGQNFILGSTSSALLTNVDNTIAGGGQLGDGQLIFINKAGGVVDGTVGTALVLNTGANMVTNAGFLQADLGGTLVINSAVNNTGGTIEANGGFVQVNGLLSGAGSAVITSGTLEFSLTKVSQNVTFTTANGTLQLDHSQTYTGSVTGFSHTLGTAFDLRDIGFNGSTTATYNAGTGNLTVSNGTVSAVIHLVGNYSTSTFNVTNDGAGGTQVTDPPKGGGGVHTATAHFVSAMASLGASSGVAEHHSPEARFLAPVLLAARCAAA